MQNTLAVTSQPSTTLLILTVVLWVLVAASALLVVKTTHGARLSYFQLESLRREAADLEVQRGQYLLEQSTWAAYSRVEKLAQQQLNMRVPEPAEIVMVTP